MGVHVMRWNGILGTIATSLVLTSLASAAGTDEAWLARVKDNLERMEYDFRALPDGTISAPNRAHGFRVAATPGGIAVTSRIDGGGWRLGLEASSWGRSGPASPLTEGILSHDGARITFLHDGVIAR